MKLWPWLMLAWSALAAAQSYTNDDLWRLRGRIQARDFGLEQLIFDKMLEAEETSQRKVLRDAKFLIINGETAKARQVLFPLLKREQNKSRPILQRYLALADFQDGKWSSALQQLSSQDLMTAPHFGRVCPLRIVLRIAVRDTRELSREWGRCKIDNAREFLNRDTVWMDALVRLATRERPGAVTTMLRRYNPLNLSNDDLKSVLKLALYLNMEDLMVEQLDKLDYSVVQDEELRELIAQAYFRQGQLVNAWRMMQDISSPNVDNMKGNLWLLRGNQELAYAQFKLALQQKSNSHNAVERALPLAWALQQWKEGKRLSERVFTHEKNKLQQMTTTAAFSVAQGQWLEARENLDLVHQKAGDNTAQEVSQLSTYVALRLNDQRQLNRHASKSCEGGDLVACWLLSSAMVWPDLPVLLSQNSEFEPLEPLQRALASEGEKFQDESFIDQRDVDELDDALIKLVN